MPPGSLAYAHSFAVSWYLLWRSVVAGLGPGLLGGACLLWLNDVLARHGIAYVKTFLAAKPEGSFWAVVVPAFIFYQMLKEAWDQISAQRPSYFAITLAFVGITLFVSSILTGTYPAAPGLAVGIPMFYIFTCPALGILGGLAFFSNGLIGKRFSSFQLVSKRHVTEGVDRIAHFSPAEQLRVGWFFFWRGFGIGALVDLTAVLTVLILAYPMLEPATMQKAMFYATRASASSGLLLSVVFVGFPLSVAQLLRKNFKTGKSQFVFELVVANPQQAHYK